MKLRSKAEGLAIVVTFAAVLAKDFLVTLTGDKTVNKAGADAVYVGRVVKPPKAANDTGTIETPFKERWEIKASGAIAAGDRVKFAAADGVTGENRVTKWTSQTDAAPGDKPDSLLGVCLVGGADGATVEVLVY